MTEDRWYGLAFAGDGELTEEEIQEGWHFCYEFDGLLVGPGMGELSCCRCLPKDHPVYLTTPPKEKVDESKIPF